MSNSHNLSDVPQLASAQVPSQTTCYQIRLQGHLGPQWEAWFDGMAVHLCEQGDTLLTGAVPDQAALFGLLRKVRDVGLPLISVNRVDSDDVELSRGKM